MLGGHAEALGLAALIAVLSMWVWIVVGERRREIDELRSKWVLLADH